MSQAIVKQLILKDWYLLRWPILGYLAAGALALLFLGVGGAGSFYAGTIVLITVLIGLGIQLALATAVNERTQQTLPFVMTLPISNFDYTAAKVIANLSLFLLPWTALIAGTLAVLNARSEETRSLIPLATLTLFELLAAFCLLLFVALVSESQPWTVGVMVVPSIAQGMKEHRLIWSADVFWLLLLEVAIIVLLLVLTFVFRARKTDFL